MQNLDIFDSVTVNRDALISPEDKQYLEKVTTSFHENLQGIYRLLDFAKKEQELCPDTNVKVLDQKADIEKLSPVFPYPKTGIYHEGDLCIHRVHPLALRSETQRLLFDCCFSYEELIVQYFSKHYGCNFYPIVNERTPVFRRGKKAN